MVPLVNKAFEAAGFKNRLKSATRRPDMDPMDVRYNQIYWVDRDERRTTPPAAASPIPAPAKSWPRASASNPTGPHCQPLFGRPMNPRSAVAAGRRQRFRGRISGRRRAALPPYSTPETEQQLVLLRQALLTAHETGHTLGFDHKLDVQHERSRSVMEYPSPRIKIVNGKIDLTDAYQKQIGAYDIMTFDTRTPSSARAGKDRLRQHHQRLRKQGLTYTPQTDPRWNRYDDGPDPPNICETPRLSVRSCWPTTARPFLRMASRTATSAVFAFG